MPFPSRPCAQMTAGRDGCSRAISARCPAMLGMNGVAHEKIVNQGQDLLAGIFQHVVPRVRELVHLGGRENFLPLVQEVMVKDKIPVAPEYQRGGLSEFRQF